ncbi:thiamine ABC transporter substrate-binding protein [Actinokineospora sp. HUAS TT18]|uniref:thiamine ABC transporter substrate-binding protein n=1 Tax=Actinokineospora sp. HUAS TT18 TaxID=3447451 RepID=UPI003F5256A0
MRLLPIVGLTLMLVAACTGTSAPTSDDRVVTLVTHDSFVVTPERLEMFKNATGVTIKVLASGDAGELANKLVLTKENPIGDVVFGIDSTFASRVLRADVLAGYSSPEAKNGAHRYQLAPANLLHAVDVGDVCVNIDTARLADGAGPRTYEDLLDPKYRDMTVVEDPATSSPGLAFMLGTIANFGESGWLDYWAKLKANGVKVTSGWEEAYTQEFSGSSGKGPRPIVVSYASSPAAEIGDNGVPRTSALLDTCYRQVEYAGVLNGASNFEDAAKVVDFLLSEPFQSDVPEQMYVYPTRDGVALPDSWSKAAPLPAASRSLPGDAIDANRERWVEQWRAVVFG